MLRAGGLGVIRIPTVLTLLLCAGCIDTKGGTSGALVTNDGTATLEVDLSRDESAMLVTVQGNALLAVDSIFDPDGDEVFHWNDWYSVKTYLTAAVWPLGTDMVLNWPVRAEDAQLSKGTWEIKIAAVNEKGVYLDGEKLDARVQTKEDADFSDGEIKVVIALADGVEDDLAVVSAIEASVERWREVWDPIGLSLSVRYATADIDTDLPYVGEGSEEIAELSEQVGSDEILMLVGETIRSEELYYGVSGNIPGSLVSTPRSAVAIGWLANTGLDGEFSSDDIRLMGETMAHETSHYMGLFHPVETSFDVWDAVRDTENCTHVEACESSLGDNLMYPYPVCSAFSCMPQDALTDIQTGIVHRYTGAR